MAVARSQHVVIVGAGIGGLAAAAILSRTFDVTVYERAALAGGKVRQIDISGSRIDSGPTVFTMRWVFDEIFAEAGADFENLVRLARLDTIARHAWSDGAVLDLDADITKSAANIEAFAGADEARRFLDFCMRAERTYKLLEGPFLRAPKASLISLMLQRNPIDLSKIDPYATLWSALERQFRDPRLRQLFGRYATYCGSSPFACPATLMLVAHVEQQGVWTLEGGMKSLAEALQGVAERNGARLVYNAEVAEILFDGGRACGLRLADGEQVAAGHVVVNADAGAVAAGRFGKAAATAVGGSRRKTRSQSALTWSMLADASGFDLSVHNVFFSDNYRDEFDAVFRRGDIPQAPTAYVFAPDRPLTSAPGRNAPERLFCLINAPSNGDKRQFGETEIRACETRTFDQLQRFGLTIRPSSEGVVTTTPRDFDQMFPGTGGAIYGMATHGWRASFQRPGVRTRSPGLYLAGGSVHPGPGVPMAALSGRAAARAIRKECGLT